MGQCHIITIYEDGISGTGGPGYELLEQPGRAAIDLCVAPQHEWTDEGPARVKDAQVGQMGNCLTWVDDVHSTEERVYVWAGNCLRPFNRLSRDIQEAIISDLQNQLAS